MLLGGWEHVEDAAADSEVPALLDELGPGVPGADQVGDDVAQLQPRVPRMQLDRHQFTQARHLRL